MTTKMDKFIDYVADITEEYSKSWLKEGIGRDIIRGQQEYLDSSSASGISNNLDSPCKPVRSIKKLTKVQESN